MAFLVILGVLLMVSSLQTAGESPCPEGGSGLFPDADSCARFFLCANGEVIPYSTRYLAFECLYPTLFSEQVSYCQPYHLVDCGDRLEPVQPCDYYGNISILDPWPGHGVVDLDLSHSNKERLQRRSIGRDPDLPPGVSCDMAYPTCEGLPDGLNPWIWREGSPYHVDCLDERNVRNRFCDDDEFGYVMRFSVEQNRCMSQWEFPKDDNGRRPDCSNRPDGFFLDESDWCSYYFECRNGDFHKFFQCADGKFFSTASKMCEDEMFAPVPCGNAGSPDCLGKEDGLHPDANGRAEFYFVCAGAEVRGVFRCQEGEVFNPVLSQCETPRETSVPVHPPVPDGSVTSISDILTVLLFLLFTACLTH